MLKCASLAADEGNKSKNATVQETRKVCRRLLHSLFAVVARDLLASFYKLRTPEKNFKQIKIFLCKGVREPLTHACTDLNCSKEICALSHAITVLYSSVSF